MLSAMSLKKDQAPAHNNDNAIAATAERIIRLEDGQVVYDGPTDAAASGLQKDKGADE